MRPLTQNEREQYSHILRFKESLSDFPEGTLCFADNPDVLVKTPAGIWGIEHTRLYRGSMKEQESLEQKIIDRAKKMYVSSGAPSLYVTVSFDSNFRLTVKDIDLIAANLNDIVCRYIPNVGENFELEGWKFIPRRFSPAITTIFINRPYPSCELSWDVERGGVVPDLASDQIRETIQGKEPKLGDYLSRCSKVWLLIVADGFAPSSDFSSSDEVKKQVYKSSFDRIFLFRNFSCEAFELDVKH